MIFWMTSPVNGLAASENQISGVNSPEFKQCGEAVMELGQDHQLIITELGQLRRDNALLRQSLEKPGLRETLGGIGYILGLLGTAFFFAGKSKK